VHVGVGGGRRPPRPLPSLRGRLRPRRHAEPCESPGSLPGGGCGLGPGGGGRRRAAAPGAEGAAGRASRAGGAQARAAPSGPPGQPLRGSRGGTRGAGGPRRRRVLVCKHRAPRSVCSCPPTWGAKMDRIVNSGAAPWNFSPKDGVVLIFKDVSWQDVRIKAVENDSKLSSFWNCGHYRCKHPV
jgi:hypothetical protein